MGRDLYSNPYGRFYNIPRLLAEKGHTVTVALCSYKYEPDAHKKCLESGASWHSANALHYYRYLCMLIENESPDWLIGFSDTYYGILAQHLAARYGLKSVIDAYDNYESYIPWCNPLHYLWRRALTKSDVITAAGPELLRLIGTNRDGKAAEVIPMAVDQIGFKPIDKIECRNKLNLPIDKKLIGYCGSIHPSRGIEVLFEAFKKIHSVDQNIELVLSGKKSSSLDIPDGAHWLGYIPDNLLPYLLNSMDVLAILNKSTTFGNHSYPIKLYEAMCCQVPVVATETPATRWILNKYQNLLASPGDINHFVTKLTEVMSGKDRIDYGEKEGWDKSCCKFEKLLINESEKI